jgi:hypothetical protein
MTTRRRAPLPRALLSGEQEGAFDCLPETVIANLRRPHSENARLWNSFHPRPGVPLNLTSLLAIRPLWGQPGGLADEEALEPFFWGYSAAGEALPGLDAALDETDGPTARTEVDLVLLGSSHLIVMEAKNLSTLGRCGRYQRRVCPEVHRSADHWMDCCRYWDVPEARFDRLLDFGARPGPGAFQPPCARHYQLARTLLLGEALARRRSLRLQMWALVPASRWSALEGPWLDFVDRVRDPDLWRRLRVVAWDDLATRL